MPPLRRAALTLALLVAVASAACRPPAEAAPVSEVAPARYDAPLTFAPKDRVRIVLIGDTGYPGPEIEAVHRAVAAETKDLIVVLGDLVYPAAPRCPTGALTADVRELLDRKVGAALKGLGAPVLLALGNHDVNHVARDPERTACLLAYAEAEPELFMPARAYTVDLGLAMLAVLDSNDLDDAQGELARAAFKGHSGWKLMAAHHVLKTYRDKASEDSVRPWLAAQRLAPDAWLNGHAHLLQFGVYGGIAAVTSGATAVTRERAACPPDCGEGELFGASKDGYAVLEVTASRLAVTFKDTAGSTLFSWSKDR